MALLAKKRLTIYGACLSCGISSGVAAADDYLSMDIEQLLQISITGATLRDESLKTVPSAVTVFTHDQIAALGMDYLHELLSLVPDYQTKRAADSPANFTFSVRGRRNGTQAREVLLLVDGRRFINPRSGSSDVAIPLFPLAQIERIEIIRGPGSALYGSSAFTGVINVITRKRTSEATVTIGSDSRRSLDVLWGHESGDWESSFFAHGLEDQGQDYGLRDLTTPIAQASTDPVRSVNLDMGLRYKQTQFRITYNRADSDNFYVLERISNNFNRYRNGFSQFSVEHSFNLAENIGSTFTLSYGKGEQWVNTELADIGVLLAQGQALSEAPFYVQAILEGETYSAALANDWNISELASSQFGIEISRDNETYSKARSNYDLSQFVELDFPIDHYEQMTHIDPIGLMNAQKSIGAYGQYLRKLTNKTNLTLGVRYDNYSGVADHFSPRIGLVHQLTDNQTLKLLYGEAFRAPTLSETGLINNTRLVGNPGLTHELVKTWDLIWMGNWQNTSVSLNGFYSRYDQPIIAGLIGTTRTYVNAGIEESNGMSLEASQQLNPHWLVRITYSHILELPDSAFRESDQLASITLNYKQQAWNWNVAAVYQNESQTLSPVNTRNTLDDFWVVNSKLGYELTRDVGINLQIKNLLGEHYFSPAQANGIADGVPNRGREWSLGLEWRW